MQTERNPEPETLAPEASPWRASPGAISAGRAPRPGGVSVAGNNPFNWINQAFGRTEKDAFGNDILKREYGHVDYTVGAGLGWNRDNSFNIRVTNDLMMNRDMRDGWTGTGAQWTDTFAWNADGGFEGVTNDIRLTTRWQLNAEARQNYARRMAELADQGDLEGMQALQDYGEDNIFFTEKKATYLRNRISLLSVALGREVTPEELQQILAGEHPTLTLSDALEIVGNEERNALGLETPDSRTSLWDKVSGAIGDAYQWAFTDTYSDADGFIDPETGEWRQRTCFVAGTLVVTENGYTPIEEIEAGDSVLSWNEKTNAREYKRVVQTFQRTTDRIYIVKYSDGTTLETTWNHEFYIEGKGWMDARNLQAGDRSPTADGRVLTIASVSIDARFDTVYNFEVEGNHTYYVGARGVLVHNQEAYFNPEAYITSYLNSFFDFAGDGEEWHEAMQRVQEQDGVICFGLVNAICAVSNIYEAYAHGNYAPLATQVIAQSIGLVLGPRGPMLTAEIKSLLFRNSLVAHVEGEAITVVGRGIAKHPGLVGLTKENFRQTLRTDAAINKAGAEFLAELLETGTPRIRQWRGIEIIELRL